MKKLIVSLFLSGFMLISHAADVHVIITGLSSTKGTLRLALVNSQKQFQQELEGNGRQQTSMSIDQRTTRYTFTDIEPGKYAIIIFHDVNDNQFFDRRRFGKPVEAYGFSRNPKPLFWLPSFEASSFKVGNHDIEMLISLDHA